MKKALFLLVMTAGIVNFAYASDYQGNEKQDSVFQKLGDLITGRYEVEKGKTLKEVGITQVVANQVKDIKNGPVQ